MSTFLTCRLFGPTGKCIGKADIYPNGEVIIKVPPKDAKDMINSLLNVEGTLGLTLNYRHMDGEKVSQV